MLGLAAPVGRAAPVPVWANAATLSTGTAMINCSNLADFIFDSLCLANHYCGLAGVFAAGCEAPPGTGLALLYSAMKSSVTSVDGFQYASTPFWYDTGRSMIIMIPRWLA